MLQRGTFALIAIAALGPANWAVAEEPATAAASAVSEAETEAKAPANAEAATKARAAETPRSNQAVPLNMAIGQTAADGKRETRLHLNTQLEIASTMHELDDARKTTSATMLMIPQLELDSKFMPLALIQVDAPIDGHDLETRARVSRVDVGTIYAPVKLNPYLSFMPMAWMTTPFGANARDRVSLVAAVRLAPRLLFNLDPAKLPVTGFVEVAGTRSFHEFETTTQGESNSPYSLSSLAFVIVNLSPKWSLMSAFAVGTSWTYQGNVTSRFSWSEGINFQLNDQLAFGAQISNAGPTLRANGIDSNVSLIDPERTLISGLVTYAF